MKAKQKDNIDYISSSKKVIYLIEDDSSLTKRISRHLEHEFPGHEVQSIDSYEIALKKIIHQKPQVIICVMETASGESCFDSLLDPLLENELTRKIPVVIMANRADLNREKEKIDFYNINIVPKPPRIPLLINTVDEAIKNYNSINVKTLNLEPNEVLFREGEAGENIYYLKSGELDIYKQVKEDFVLLATISKPQLVGEMAFLDGERSASIVTKTKCELLKLNLGDIKRFIAEQPFWLGMIIDTLAGRIKELNEKLVLS